MGNKFVIKAENCTGCHDCEVACAMHYFGSEDRALSRIRVVELPGGETAIPVVCQSCTDADCVKVCPMNGRVQLESGVVMSVQEKCIGCRACIYICHNGGPTIHPETGKTISCEQCLESMETPPCVLACGDRKALMVTGSNDLGLINRREYAVFFKRNNSSPSNRD